MRCAFVCVNFNGAGITEKFLRSVSLFVSESRDNQVVSVVVDNASSPDDFALLKAAVERYRNVLLVRSDVNLGYFGGLNFGLAALDFSLYDYVVVGNNDLEYSANFLDKLVNNVYESDVMVVAPDVVTNDGYHQNPHCPNRVSTSRKFLYRLYYLGYGVACFLTWGSRFLKFLVGGRRNDAFRRSQYIHMGIGACYVLTKAFFKVYSRLDDSVFLYGEEALLAGQVMAAKGRTYYDSSLVVLHAESATLSALPSRRNYDFRRESYPKYRAYL